MYWFKFEGQDYMDECPQEFFRLFASIEDAKAFEKHMQENYSGGDTKLIGYATKKDVFNFLYQDIIDGLLDEETLRNISNNNYYMETKQYYVDPLDTEGLVPQMDEEISIDDVIYYNIENMRKYNLEYEVVFTALNSMKKDPTQTPEEAFINACNDWIK